MHEAAAAIRGSGVVGIVRSASGEDAASTATALLRAGLPAVEISLVTPDGLEAVRTAAAVGVGWVGAGTVLDVPSVVEAARAGASFVVSPVLDPDVVAVSRRYGLATLPGVATPTEAQRAVDLGADFAKLFPASAYGPEAVRDLLTALPRLPMVPTGGVTAGNAAAYVRAGATAVGLGSALTGAPPEAVSRTVREVLNDIATARALAQ